MPQLHWETPYHKAIVEHEDEKVCEEWVAYGNKTYPDIRHWRT